MKRGACVLAAVVVAAGCGGSSDGRLSKSRYEAKMSSIVRELTAAPSLRSFSPTDLPAVDRYFQRLASTFDRLHGELVTIRPPKNVDTQHSRLVEAAGRAGHQLAALARRLKEASPADRQRILTSYDSTTEKLLTALNDVEAAGRAIAAQGYELNAT